jgi:hypothetical protein
MRKRRKGLRRLIFFIRRQGLSKKTKKRLFPAFKWILYPVISRSEYQRDKDHEDEKEEENHSSCGFILKTAKT